MAVKKKVAKKEEKKVKEVGLTGQNGNEMVAKLYGEGSERKDYISFFGLLTINGIQISGNWMISTNDKKDSFFSFPKYYKEADEEYIPYISIKDDELKADLNEIIALVESSID